MGNLRAQSKITCKLFAAALVVFAVFSAQNALAIATAESTAYLNWDSFSYTGATLTGTDQVTGYGAGYSTPNNPGAISPDFDSKNYNDHTHFRSNPAGEASGTAKAETPGGPPGQQLYDNVWAQSDGLKFGDNINEVYQGFSQISREGTFTVASDGSYTFSVDYYLNQMFDVDYLSDVATTTANFYLYILDDTGATILGQDSLVDQTLQYISGASMAGTNTENGTLTILDLDLQANTEYYFYMLADNYARASSDLSDPNPPPSVPEPATLVLVGSGLVGAAISRRKKHIHVA